MLIREKLAERRSVEPSGFRWRGGEVSRLEQFSDAVFAFALALLVVSVDVPGSVDQLFAKLRDFPAFGATFAVLVWIWYLHFLYFRRFGFEDALATFLNAVLLFIILFYVYPLKFLAGTLLDGLAGGGWAFSLEQGRTLLVVYSVGFVAVFAMFALLYRHALGKEEELELDAVEVLITRASMWANLLLVAVGALSAVLAGFGPPWATPVAGFLYFVIGPLMWWHWSRVRRRREALVRQSAERGR